MPNGYQGVVFLTKEQLESSKPIEEFYQVGQKIQLKILTIDTKKLKASLVDKSFSKKLVVKKTEFCATQKDFVNLKQKAEEQLNEFKVKNRE
ncbi:general stress protein 13 [Mesomycoplasma conjunctivae]|uniref:S1 motif domain-containing protein n=1 Tax=Mesomycoplasma conjunctivae (strain ATCC 25834 / NCTC 10147 / HRC/581) TaxID=572263 RepID=C5J7D6_MESCH|nr:hypothetical protein [Mesomycoplasma conjunctivae]CAT05399.1 HYPOTHETICAL PROTEIN MCJ_007150 [Mesomycoplasma conjunctivae]VEU66624.1 general stress protein 13 [Mesomycoplasma conjunctivae]